MLATSLEDRPNKLPKELSDALSNKRIVFTITTGRSGTTFLSEVLSRLPGVTSLHEPAPDFADVREALFKNPDLATDFLLNQKLPAIGKDPNPYYIETSHLFCKGFVEPLLQLGVVPDIVLLTRDPHDVALSLYQLGTIPGRSDLGKKYLIAPDENPVVPLSYWNQLHDYQLCFWYCHEIHWRIQKYELMFRRLGARVARTSLNFLSTPEGLAQLTETLEFPSFSKGDLLRHSWRGRSKSNSKDASKRTLDEDLDFQQMENDVVRLINTTRARKLTENRAKDLKTLQSLFPFLPDLTLPVTAPDSLALAYENYISSVSTFEMAASLETATLINSFCQGLQPRKLLDLGSGFSSYVLRSYSKKHPGVGVYSVDDDAKWLERTGVFLSEAGLDTSNLVEWSSFQQHASIDFDFIFYDLGNMETRANNLDKILELVKGSASILLVDDVHKDEYYPYFRQAVNDWGLDTFELYPASLDSIGRHSAIVIDPQFFSPLSTN